MKLPTPLPHGLALRPSTAQDKPFLEQLYNHLRQDLRLADAEDDYIESVIEMQFRAQSQGYGDQFPNAMYFIVEKHHERIGKLTLDFGSNEIRVVDLALIPAAQGKGMGKAVLQAVQATATQVMAPVTLTVANTNLVAQQFYAKLGFQVSETNPVNSLLAWYPSKP